MLGKQIPIKIPPTESPKLIVVIDTEEEFDWSSEPMREANSVSAMSLVGRVQDIFDEYSIIPCYVVDFPVASKKEGHEILKEIYSSGRCEIGAHLHPWVNPPFDEELTKYNTFPGNLPIDLEREKLKKLRTAIYDAFGVETKIYKAGRYGVGEHTAEILEEAGFEIDLSICPPVDFTSIGGPDFSDFLSEPYWFGNRRLLEIPVTGAFVGWAGPLSKPLYNLAYKFKKFRLPGLLSKSAAVDRLILSPEGFDTDDHKKITNFLYNKGVRTFTWSFHSPSVVPGCTPYVKNDVDLQKFLDSFRKYFDFFFDELNGEASTPTMLKCQLERTQ